MATDTETLKKKSLLAIKKHKITLITEVCSFIGISEATFYRHELHKDEDVQNEILANKVHITWKLKSKWFLSDNPTLQIALFKLTCSEDEAHRLNATKREIKTAVVNHETILEELEDDE